MTSPRKSTRTASSTVLTSTPCSETTSPLPRNPRVEEEGVYASRANATQTGDREPQVKPHYHYCVVRSDLPFGVIAAMLVHAAGESIEFGSWMGDLSDADCEVCTTRPGRSSAHFGCGRCVGHGKHPLPIHAVVLAVENEAQLLEIDRRLDAAGIEHRSVREPDAPWNGALMSIGLVPVKDRSKLRKFVSSIPLLSAGSSVGRVPVSQDIAVGGSSPSLRTNTRIAQRVERLPFEEGGGSAGLPLGTK